MKLDRVIAVRNQKTVYRDGDYSIKVFGAEYSKSDVLNEALNQALIEEIGLPIPAIREVTLIDGKWAIVSEYIKGKPLDRLMQENPERRYEHLALMVNLQMQIHAKTCLHLGTFKDKLTRKIIQCDLDATTRYSLHTRLEGMPRHNKTCHGDFDPSNIVISDSGKPYILDWSHATRGNASADVAQTYLLFCLREEDELANAYLDLFCDKSGTPRRYVMSWLPLIAAAQSVTANEREKEWLLARIKSFETD